MDNAINQDNSVDENLFRSLICAPLAIVFALMAVNLVGMYGLTLFNFILVLVTLYFVLTSIAYAAFYTNELFEGNANPLFDNKNLTNALICAPLAVLFVMAAYTSITSAAHVFFNFLFVLLAGYFVLSTLAYAAFYTNDYHAEHA